jgi:hypothetical protein
VAYGYWEQKGLTSALTDQGPYEFAAGPFRTRCPGDPTVSITFWSKFSPVDFNRDVAACLIFIPCTTSPAIFNPVFKASRSRVFVPLFNKGPLSTIFQQIL